MRLFSKPQKEVENQPLIDISNVYKIYHLRKGFVNGGEDSCKNNYGEINALDGVSIKIMPQEFVSIVGKSGSGKSTLMNILGCLDLPSQGEYLLRGRSISDYTERELSHIRNKEIGFIFQGFNLIPELSALENVELPLMYRGVSKAARRKSAMESLARVGLCDRIHHRPGEISGGQQQRVAIARAITAKPPIILADEPTGNLDSQSGSDIINILSQLNSEGHTIILITHDDEIAGRAHRIVKLNSGRVEEDLSMLKSS